MPPGHKNGHLPRYLGDDRLPPSLVEAIDSFLLACAARRARGQTRRHSSMLIHVTRFNSVQDEVRRQVESHVGSIRQRLMRRIGAEPIIRRLRALWEKDFEETIRNTGAQDAAPVSEHPGNGYR